METTIKPAKIPLEVPAKYHKPKYGFLFILIWCLPMYGALLLELPVGIYLGFIGVWNLFIMMLSLLPCYYDLILFPDRIQVRLFGKVIQQIPLSDLKCIYCIGSGRLHFLCLSAWNVEELAQRWEKNLQKGHFSKQELPFMKKRPGWQEQFAKEYLLKPDWSIVNLHARTPILWLPVDPVIGIFLRRMYPQLPYMDMRNPLSEEISMLLPDQIPFYSERYRADEEGLHVFRHWNKQELRCFPADKIKTIVRVDRFVQNSKVEPAYANYLVVSELSVSELAQRGRQKRWNKWKKQLIEQLPEAEEMYAAEFYCSTFFSWNWRKATECHIRYTAEAENLLRQLYPHAQWVDYSNKWL